MRKIVLYVPYKSIDRKKVFHLCICLAKLMLIHIELKEAF